MKPRLEQPRRKLIGRGFSANRRAEWQSLNQPDYATGHKPNRTPEEDSYPPAAVLDNLPYLIFFVLKEQRDNAYD
jgi:hypothetical protein